MKTAKLAKSYRIDDGKNFRLKDFDPADTGHLQSIDEAKEHLQKGIARMEDLQASFTPRTAGLCCSSFRPWTRPGKTAPSSTSCPESIRKAARCIRSKRPRPRN